MTPYNALVQWLVGFGSLDKNRNRRRDCCAAMQVVADAQYWIRFLN
jgi:hypothetical protein